MPSSDEIYQDRILEHYEEPFHRGPCPRATHAHEDDNHWPCRRPCAWSSAISGSEQDRRAPGSPARVAAASAMTSNNASDRMDLRSHGRRGQAFCGRADAGAVRASEFSAQSAEVLLASLAGVAVGNLLATCRPAGQSRRGQGHDANRRAEIGRCRGRCPIARRGPAAGRFSDSLGAAARQLFAQSTFSQRNRRRSGRVRSSSRWSTSTKSSMPTSTAAFIG